MSTPSYRSMLLRSIRSLQTVLVAFAFACGDGQPVAPDGPPTSEPIAVELRLSVDRVALLSGDSVRVTAATYDAAERRIYVPLEWSSADPTVATVQNDGGLVTGIAEGSTTVTVKAGQLRVTLPVSVLKVAGTITFTRITYFGGPQVRFDVLSYSNGTVESLPRSSEFASIATPAWSPDGSRLAVEVIRDVQEDFVNHYFTYTADVYVLNPDAPTDSPWRRLTSDGQSRSPSWSPDGRRIGFVRGPITADHPPNYLYVIDVASGTPTPLIQAAGSYSAPRWSPDGSKVAFANYGHVYVANSDGTNVINLAPSGNSPNWSPDGRRIVFTRQTSPLEYAVFVMDADGSNLRQLTSNSSNADPTWSPDGRYIAFAAGGIHIMRIADLASVRVTQGSDASPVWKY